MVRWRRGVTKPRTYLENVRRACWDRLSIEDHPHKICGLVGLDIQRDNDSQLQWLIECFRTCLGDFWASLMTLSYFNYLCSIYITNYLHLKLLNLQFKMPKIISTKRLPWFILSLIFIWLFYSLWLTRYVMFSWKEKSPFQICKLYNTQCFKIMLNEIRIWLTMLKRRKKYL